MNTMNSIIQIAQFEVTRSRTRTRRVGFQAAHQLAQSHLDHSSTRFHGLSTSSLEFQQVPSEEVLAWGKHRGNAGDSTLHTVTMCGPVLCRIALCTVPVG